MSTRSHVQAAPVNHRFVREVNPLSVAEALERHAAPAHGPRRVQVLRPFSVVARSELSMPLAPPIGPAYLAAMLEAAGYEVDLVDAIGEDPTGAEASECGRFKRLGLSVERILERIDPEAAVLGVSFLFSEEWVEHKKLLTRIRAAHPDLVIVAGGEHASALPEYLLRDCPALDYVISGEGELALLELVHHVCRGSDPRGMPGLSYLDEQGDYRSGGASRRIEDFANLPRPAWHLVPVRNYKKSQNSHGIDRGFSMPIVATRGCPFQCTFCSSPNMWTTRYVTRDPKEVVDEVEELIARYGIEGVNVADLTAFTRKRWVLDLCAELRRRDLHVSWQIPSGTRSEALDEETLSALYAVNCRDMTYAPESGSQQSLATIKKRVKLDNMTASVRAALRLGFVTKVNIIIGFPHETRRNVWETMGFVLRMAAIGVNDCYPWLYSPYPGSELYEKLRADGIVPEPCDEYFDALHGISNFTVAGANCTQLPLWELNVYRAVTTVLFYLISYSLRPGRLWRLLRSIVRPGFVAQNLLEQRLYEMLLRRRRSGDLLEQA